MTDRLSAADLFRLRWLDLPRLARDGTRLAYLETVLDETADRARQHVVVQSIDSDAPPRRLEVADANGLAWSPDGAALAVTGDGLWIIGPDGSAECIAVAQSADPAWSPDGERLAFVDATEAPARVRVVGSDGRDGPSFDHPGATHHPRWSPDGRHLAFLRDDGLWLSDTTWTAPPRRIATPLESATAFGWAPDSTRLAVLGRADRDLIDVGQRLWLVEVATGAARELVGPPDAALGSAVRGDDPRGTGSPALCWSSASGRIYVESVHHGRGPVVWFDSAAAGISAGTGLLLDGDHAALSPSLSETGRLAVILCGPDGPGDVWITDEDGSEIRRLTDANDQTRHRAAATEQHVVEHDGVTTDAWLTTYGGAEPAPLVVSVHGGPYYAIGWRFTFEVQRLASAGAAVLTLNPRGSSGCGDLHAAANRGDWGGVDAADVLAVVDAMTGRPDVDASRIALLGVSYGGFLTQWLLTNTDRFRTAVSENGISDFLVMWDARPTGRPFWRLALGGTPSSSDRFVKRSPLHSADRIRTPLLLVHAEEDETCPIEQSERMASALRALGADVEFVRLAGEGHLVNLIGRPSSRIRRAAEVDRWLARTLYR